MFRAAMFWKVSHPCHMPAAKVCSRLVETQVQGSNQMGLKWHPRAYDMESHMIRNDRAYKQKHAAVRGK
eukprot:3898235-Amphidinium_carterae.1